MKNIILKLRKKLPRPSVLRSLIFVFGFGYIGFAYASLFPGELTGSSAGGEAIGGYVSHAQFEKGCMHCHAPLHCVEDERCQDCHVEVAQERAEMSGMHGLLPGTNRCQNCHVEHLGREADITTLAFKRIDHAALANFSLDYHQEDYAGEAMDCQSCHSQDDYREASLDCITCHAEEDHNLLASHIEEHGSQCLSCHDGKTRLAEFEHNTQAFNLTGAHAEVECMECHTDPGLQYREVPTDCAGCHLEDQPEEHGSFGTNCTRCHETAAFTPARLKQHTFDLTHGGLSEPECQTCHNHSYAEVNCMGCHTEGGRVAAIHQVQLGIIEMDDCASCHPTGTAHDLIADDNFPQKSGYQAGESHASPIEASEGTSQGQIMPTAEPTFSSKDAGQAPHKEQEGNSTRP